MEQQNVVPPTEQADLQGEISGKLHEIAQVATERRYIFRGEPEFYDEVSSGIFRKHRHNILNSQDIELIEQQIIKKAKEFSYESSEEIDEIELMSLLQHFGHRTNFIDFTTDYNIALFFACDGSFHLDGRIVFLEENSSFELVTPRGPTNRLIAQKSIFVRPRLGFVEPNRSVNIPNYLKKHILKLLADGHGITPTAIYNDIHGFIRYSNLHVQANEEFDYGVAQQSRDNFTRASQHYAEAIRLNPRHSSAYSNRASCYYRLNRKDEAFDDCNEAISIDPDNDLAYNIRGLIFSERRKTDNAMDDFNKVVDLFPTQPFGFSNRGILRCKIGQFCEALEDCNIAIGINSAHVLPYLGRCAALLGLQRFDEALQDIQNIRQLGFRVVEVFESHLGGIDAFLSQHEIELPAELLGEVHMD